MRVPEGDARGHWRYVITLPTTRRSVCELSVISLGYSRERVRQIVLKGE